jgi:hypothetical protein
MAYGKPYAITDAIIQAARTKACAEIFGDANENCKYVHHIKEALEKEEHIVKLHETSRRETIQNVERIVIHDELLRQWSMDLPCYLQIDKHLSTSGRKITKSSSSISWALRMMV